MDRKLIGIADPPPATSSDSTMSDAELFDLALMLMLEEEPAGEEAELSRVRGYRFASWK